MAERGVGPRGSELWASEKGATNHVSNDARKVYDWVEILLGRDKVLIGDGKAMRVLGVGSLNIKMHSQD